MIQLKQISVIFNQGTPLETIALNKINLKIDASDFIVLVGNNGAGKSTLLKVLAGEFFSQSGQILFEDKDATFLSVENRVRFVSHVYQDPRTGTYESFSIEENLALAYYRGQKRGFRLALNKKLRQHFHLQLKKLELGLEHRLNDPVYTLSGGQRQALSLLMATLQPPKLLLLDEHTAALDPKTAAIVLELTQKIIKEQQLTALMITHNMHQALTLGNRLILMKEGNILFNLTENQRKKLTLSELMEYF